MGKMKGFTKGLAALSLAVLGCQTQYPSRFDPRMLQQTQRDGAGDTPNVALRRLPTTIQARVATRRTTTTRMATTTTSPSTEPTTTEASTQPTTTEVSGTTTGPVVQPTTIPSTVAGYDPTVAKPTVRLTLQEVIHRTVANNKDSIVAAYEPAIDQTRIIEAEARFDPEFFTNFNSGESRFLTQGLANADRPTRQNQLQAGLRQLMGHGGEIELRAGTSLVDRGDERDFQGNLERPFTNPYYVNEIALQVTQPLLRDFGSETNEARITIARNTQHVSLLEFRRQLEETIENAERAYWQLTQAMRELEIAKRLLGRTEETYNILVRRQDVDVTEVQMSQAASTAALRRATLVRARSQVEQVSNQLKRIMGDPSYPVASDVVILPATDPLESPVAFDVEDQINIAMDYRLELGQQQLRIDSASIAQRVARNNLLPQLNLQLQGALNGVGYDFEDSLANFNGSEFNTWSAALQFEFPLGNRQARAIWRRAQLQRQQAIDSYHALTEQVALDVKNGVLEVEATWNELYESRNARMEANRALAAIQARETGGQALSPEFVQLKLDRQAALAEAEGREAAATAGYNAAIARLERAKGTLLRYNNIEIAEAPPVRSSRNALSRGK